MGNARYAGLSIVPCIGVDLDPWSPSMVYNGSLHPSDPMIGSLAYIKLRLSFFLWSHFTFLWHIISYRSSFIASLFQTLKHSKTQQLLKSAIFKQTTKTRVFLFWTYLAYIHTIKGLKPVTMFSKIVDILLRDVPGATLI